MPDQTDTLLSNVRKLYHHEDVPDHPTEAMAHSLVDMVAAGAKNRCDKATPRDIVVLMRIVADLITTQGVEMTMIQFAQAAGLLRVNNGGTTYGCISKYDEDTDKIPFTVLLFCNHKNMPTEQIAEFLIREGSNVRPERREV